MRGGWRGCHREQELCRRGEIDIAVAVVKRDIFGGLLRQRMVRWVPDWS